MNLFDDEARVSAPKRHRIDLRERGWVFTINNYTEDNEIFFQSLLCPDKDFIKEHSFICVGKEQGSNGTPHLQGFVRFNNKKSAEQVKDWLQCNAHVEPQKGSDSQAAKYCEKEGDVLRDGIFLYNAKKRSQHEHEKYQHTLAMAKEGKFDEIIEEHRIRFHSSIQSIAKQYLLRPPDNDDVSGIWIQGPAGCGKSKYARHAYPNFYNKLLNKWYDGYQIGQDVIMDDMDPSHDMLAYHIKIWADRYAFTAEIKGGALSIRPKNFIITSQYTIDEVFAKDERTVAAMKRRFKLVDMFNDTVKLQLLSTMKND